MDDRSWRGKVDKGCVCGYDGDGGGVSGVEVVVVVVVMVVVVRRVGVVVYGEGGDCRGGGETLAS